MAVQSRGTTVRRTPLPYSTPWFRGLLGGCSTLFVVCLYYWAKLLEQKQGAKYNFILCVLPPRCMHPLIILIMNLLIIHACACSLEQHPKYVIAESAVSSVHVGTGGDHR